MNKSFTKKIAVAAIAGLIAVGALSACQTAEEGKDASGKAVQKSGNKCSTKSGCSSK